MKKKINKALHVERKLNLNQIQKNIRKYFSKNKIIKVKSGQKFKVRLI